MKNLVLLAQTDTTVGFLSQSVQKLRAIKQRSSNKPFLKVYSSFKSFKADSSRVPQQHKKMLRRSKKSTFICKNRAFRIIKDSAHNLLLERFDFMFSTSANQSGASYDATFCFNNSDIIVEDFRALYEGKPSSIRKLGKNRIRKLR